MVTDFPELIWLIWLAEWVYPSFGKGLLVYRKATIIQNEIRAIKEVQAAYCGCTEKGTINFD